MTKKSMVINQNSIFKGLSFLVLIELVLGGSGKVISFGPLSLRMVLLGIVLICELILLLERKLYLFRNDFLLLIILFYFLINSCFSSFSNRTSDILDVLLGYLTILICPFFIYLCRTNQDIYKMYYKLFMRCSLIMAVMSIVFWLYSFFNGRSIYYSFMVRLNQESYSRMGFIGNIPRIFLKGSIFVCIAFVFSFYQVLVHKNTKNIIIMVIFLVATIMTFTLGFYFAVIITTILVAANVYKFRRRNVISILVIAIPIMLFLYSRLGIGDILIDKFSNGYSSSARIIQLRIVLNKFFDFPSLLIGKGLGTRFYVDYGYEIKDFYNLEIMWLQVLADTGIVGFALYFGYIISIIGRLRRRYIYTEIFEFYLFSIGLLIMCLVSFVNPFLNNAIGLVFFSICVGLTYAGEEQVLTQ